MCSRKVSEKPAKITTPNIKDLTKPAMAIEAKQLSKVYHLYDSPSDRLKQIILGRRKQYYKKYTALQDVSFQLPKGEVLGIVGRNGAGKSTLLQMICGTLTPSSGELMIEGRIAALLELGAGFNPDFTGRENIYLSATVMGIEKKQIEEKLEDIIEFSGVRNFIDQPVKTFSSGMYVRLAFSVATSINPDILVIDEALSVGDGDFARRSFERIMKMRDAGKTILFCSHSLYQVESLCSQAIWLEKGQIKAIGKPEEIIPQYQSFLDRLDTNVSPVAKSPPKEETKQLSDNSNAATEEQASVNAEPPLDTLTQPKPGSGARLTKITATADGICDKTLQIQSRLTDLVLNIEFQSFLENETPQLAVVIHNEGGHLITSSGSWVDGVSPEIDTEGNGCIQIVFEKLPLFKGTYYVGVLLFDERGIFLHDEADPAITLQVSQPNKERGVAYLPHRWQLPTKLSLSTAAPKAKWLAADANDVPQSDILQLFECVFGHNMNPCIWRWKYRYAETPGSVVLENGQPVAFSGGIPRAGLIFGKTEHLVQMGDVMVAKDVRGVLGKKGPFFLASQHYLTPRVGPGLTYSLAFGFPNDRACKVGVVRGIYCIVDKILEPRWEPLKHPETPLAFERLTHLNQDRLHIIDDLWYDMTEDANEVGMGVRNRDWIKHRYLDKPGSNYLLFLVYETEEMEPGVPLGLLVLKHHVDSAMELLDAVGSKEAMSYIVQAAKKITADYHCSYLFAWATPSALAWLGDTTSEVRETEVVIPGCSINDLEHALRLKDRWWIMGGDSDFR